MCETVSAGVAGGGETAPERSVPPFPRKRVTFVFTINILNSHSSIVGTTNVESWNKLVETFNVTKKNHFPKLNRKDRTMISNNVTKAAAR